MTTSSSVPAGTVLSRRATVVLASTLLLVAAAVLGFKAGTRYGVDDGVASGRAYVGAHQAGVQVGSWAYDIPTDDESLEWFDANSSHEGGVAPCLRSPGTYAWVRFGYDTVHGPDDSTWRQVTWVRCIAAP